MKPTTSLRVEDLWSEKQLSARASGDVAAMQAADDAALAEAILASLKEQEKLTVQYNNVNPADIAAQKNQIQTANVDRDAATRSKKNADEYLRIHQENTGLLLSWLDANGFDIVENRGNGKNDCLLISLLQHANNNYGSEHLTDVEHYRQALMALDPTIKRFSELPSTSDAIRTLVNWINEDKQCNLRVAIVAPGLQGEPTYHYYGADPEDEKTRYVMIIEKPGHFEAVVARRSRTGVQLPR